jgi:flagellar biogenesis protein FliO
MLDRGLKILLRGMEMSRIRGLAPSLVVILEIVAIQTSKMIKKKKSRLIINLMSRFRSLFTQRRLIFLAVPTATICIAVTPQFIQADSAVKSTSWFEDFKQQRVGIYENKLRKYSHPYKVFSFKPFIIIRFFHTLAR